MTIFIVETKIFIDNFNCLVNSTNTITSGSQTIKFVRPQQNIQKVIPSLPPLTPRVGPSTTSIVQVKFKT